VPANPEVEVGGLHSKMACSGKSMRHYLKNKLKAKRLRVWFKWLSTSLATARLRVQSSVAPKIKANVNRDKEDILQQTAVLQ
jgi:hypothetical protein